MLLRDYGAFVSAPRCLSVRKVRIIQLIHHASKVAGKRRSGGFARVVPLTSIVASIDGPQASDASIRKFNRLELATSG
jgi:hypothetical protein